MNSVYLDAVRLLIAVAPAVFRRPVFALKGGTAINLFLRGMPRWGWVLRGFGGEARRALKVDWGSLLS